MPLIRNVQGRLAHSRPVAIAALRVSCFLQGVVAYRLGHEVAQDRNGQEDLIAAIAPTVDRFFDVGPNVGDWTAYLLQLRPSATGVLVEPGKEAAIACRDRFKDRVEVVEAAAGPESGVVAFHERPGTDRHASIVAPEPGSTSREVATVTVTELVTNRGWDSVDFLKVDAEGYDLRVLEGAEALIRDRAIGVIQFEYNATWRQAGATLAAALGMFDQAGYRTWLVARGGLWRFPYETYGEFYSHSDFVAVHPRLLSRVEPLVRGLA